MKFNLQGWHPADIKAALQKAGWNFSKISRAMGHKNPRTASSVLARPYPVVEKMVAEIIGVHPAHLWPYRYSPDGSPKGRGVMRTYPKFKQVGNGNSKDVA